MTDYVDPKFGDIYFDYMNRANIITFDGYQPPLYPDRSYDAKAIVNLAKVLNIDIIRVSMLGKLAHFYTENWEVDQRLKEYDFFGDLITMAHSSGIKVIPYIPGAVHLPEDLVLKWHPNWLQKSHPWQNNVKRHNVTHSGTINIMVCPIGPYKDFYYEMLQKVIIDHDVDGWYSDAFKDCYFREECYCDHCRELFLLETGDDIHGDEYKSTGSKFDILRKWYKKKVIELVQNSHAFVRKRKRIPTIINGIYGVLGHESQGSWGKEIDNMYDVLHYERKTDPYNRYVSAGYTFMTGRKTWFYAGHYSRLQFDGPDKATENYKDEKHFPFRKELYNEYLIPLACGSSVNLIRANSLLYDEDKTGYDITREICSFISDNKQIIDSTEYIPYIGFATNQKSRSKLESPIIYELIKKGLQTTVIKDTDLSNCDLLSKFPVILATDLNIDEIKTLISNYVWNGGNLIINDIENEDLYFKSSLLKEDDNGKYYLSGRGVIAIIPNIIKDKPDCIINLAEKLTDGAPIKVSYESGELLTIPTIGRSHMLIYLINLTDCLKDMFAYGLKEIKDINKITLGIKKSLIKDIHDIKLLNKNIVVNHWTKDNYIWVKIDNIEEFDIIAVNYNNIGNNC